MVDERAGELDLLTGSLGSRFDVIRAEDSAGALATLREDCELAMVLAGTDHCEVLVEARVLRPACRRVLLTGEESGNGHHDAEAIIRVVNRAQVHQVLRRPLEVESLAGALDQLADGYQQVSERTHSSRCAAPTRSCSPRRASCRARSTTRAASCSAPTPRSSASTATSSSCRTATR